MILAIFFAFVVVPRIKGARLELFSELFSRSAPVPFLPTFSDKRGQARIIQNKGARIGLLLEQVAVRTCSNELEGAGFFFAIFVVNEKPIWLDVTFTDALVFAG